MKRQFVSVALMTIMMGSSVGPATSQIFAYKEGVKVSNQERAFFCDSYERLMAAAYYLQRGSAKEAERVEGCEQVNPGAIGIAREDRGLALRIDLGSRGGWVFLGKFLSPADWKYKQCARDPHSMGKSLFDCSEYADKESWKQ